EDGIRYFHVTGVQTCALPIFGLGLRGRDAVVLEQGGGEVGQDQALVRRTAAEARALLGGRHNSGLLKGISTARPRRSWRRPRPGPPTGRPGPDRTRAGCP